MLQILPGLEANQFKRMAMGDESWFRHSHPSSKLFARSPAAVIPRTRQTIGPKKTMITVSFTATKLVVLDVLPKGHKYNQQCFVYHIFPYLKKAN
jgi:hypothetical protein